MESSRHLAEPGGTDRPTAGILGIFCGEGPSESVKSGRIAKMTNALRQCQVETQASSECRAPYDVHLRPEQVL